MSEEKIVGTVYWFRWGLKKFLEIEVASLLSSGYRHKFAPVIEGRLRKTIVCVLTKEVKGRAS